MSQSINIPNTLLTGQQQFSFAGTNASYTNALVTIDRTITGGLNSLTTSDTLTISIDYSTDSGATWLNVAGKTMLGGVIVTKGVTLTTETLGIGIGQPFPIGTQFRVDTNASTPVRIAGTVVYS